MCDGLVCGGVIINSVNTAVIFLLSLCVCLRVDGFIHYNGSDLVLTHCKHATLQGPK